MSESASLFFDEKRLCWRVRFRRPGKDTTVNVPPELFIAAGLEPFEQSPQHERIGWSWASDEKIRREAKTKGAAGLIKLPLSSILTLYLNRNPEDVIPVTNARNKSLGAHLVKFFEGEMERMPEEIDIGAATEYRNWRRTEASAAARTIRNELSFLRRLLRWALESQFDTGMERINLHRLPKITGEDSRAIALTPDELRALLSAEVLTPRLTNRLHQIIRVGVTTMLRRSNLLGLRWEWIDLERKWLHIPAKYMKGVADRKRPLSVPLSDWTIDSLGKPANSPFVFPGVINSDKAMSDIRDELDRLAKAAEVRSFGLHDLRYTGNTLLAGAGVMEETRSALMGHVVKGTVPMGAPTTRLYTLVTVPMMRQGVSAFDALRDLIEPLTGDIMVTPKKSHHRK